MQNINKFSSRFMIFMFFMLHHFYVVASLTSYIRGHVDVGQLCQLRNLLPVSKDMRNLRAILPHT